MDRGIVAPCLLLAILALGQSRAEASSCMPGMSTPGITSPSGDITLEEGNPLEINCTLNQKQGRNSSDLTFFQGDKEVPSQYIKNINETTIQLVMDNLPVSTYIYYCKLRQPNEQHTAVCLNKVLVGSKPDEVQNFTCTSHNWQSLHCEWSIKENPVKTTYRIFFNLPGRAGRRFNATCPIDTDEKNNRCMWDQSTTPIYRQPYEYYYFALTGINKLGTVAFPAIKFHHYAHVIPALPVNLQAHNVTKNGVVLTWGVPFPLQNFPPGLLHRVEYNSRWATPNHWDIANTSTLNAHDKNLTYHLTDLQYANTVYHIRVLMKSMAAVGDGKWSKPENVTIRTSATVPGASPKTDNGGFEILAEIPPRDGRDVYIYWQQIPKYWQNGENFEYEVILQEVNEEAKNLTPSEKTLSYAKFKGLSYNSYRVTIYAKNIVGRSSNPSTITIPSHTASLPSSFTKIAFGSGIYELSWRRPTDHKNVKNYTIFWCNNERDRPYQCTGFLNWTHVPSDIYIQNITVPDDKIYQFAISANTANSSSGLLWATCTVIHNKGIGKMKIFWINKVGSTFIEVGWKLECSDRIGLVKGYRLYYCPIVSPVNRTCRDPLKNTTVAGDAGDIHGNASELMPYTTYMVGIAVMSRGGEGVQSDFLLATTLEAAPEPPYEVEVTQVRNTSIVVSWKPPRLMNGVLRNYVVYFNNKLKQVEGNTSVTLDDLPSYTNHTVYVTACTGSCSEASQSVTVQTAVGSPGMVERLVVKRLNMSQFLVSWQPPPQRNAEFTFYQLSVQEVDGANRSHNRIFNISGTDYIVPVKDCSADDKRRTYVFAVRAINLDEHNETFVGRWSEPLERDNCFDSGFSQLIFIIWICCLVLGASIFLVVWYYGKKCWLRCREMRNVEVKLPPGLDPARDSKIHTVARPADDGKHQTPGAADSVHLLERHPRNPSGDSSGCSSGPDSSVSSSLTSNTQISTDSGADVDQLNMLSEDCVARREGEARWDLLPKHGRSPGPCSARSTPNLSGVDAAACFPCLGSCPSGSALPSACSAASLYCKIGSVTTPYCKVGPSPSDKTLLRCQVRNTPKPYITHDRAAEVLRLPPPAPISTPSNGYVAHGGVGWSSPAKEAPIPNLISAQAANQALRIPRTDDTLKERSAAPALHLEVIPENSDQYSVVSWQSRQSASPANIPATDCENPVAKTNTYVKVGVDSSSPSVVSANVAGSTGAVTNSSGYVALPNQWPMDSGTGMPRPALAAPTSSSSYVPHSLPQSRQFEMRGEATREAAGIPDTAYVRVCSGPTDCEHDTSPCMSEAVVNTDGNSQQQFCVPEQLVTQIYRIQHEAEEK